MFSNKAQRGFTLAEMLTVMAVSGVLTTSVVPVFSYVMANSQIESAVGELYWAMDLARSEALVRNANVSICTAASSQACAGNSDWESGWLVFVDNDIDGVRDAGEEVLLTNTYTASNSLSFNDVVSGGDITFRSDGSVGSSKNVDICSTSSGGMRINVGAPGRITTSSLTSAECGS